MGAFLVAVAGSEAGEWVINKIKNEKINYIVEYWENDSLDIDSNQHVLFSLENEDIDIIVTKKY